VTIYIIVSNVEDNMGETIWDAFPVERATTARRVHAANNAVDCDCDIHREWRARGGSRMEVIDLPDAWANPRITVSVDGMPVHFVEAEAYAWLD